MSQREIHQAAQRLVEASAVVLDSMNHSVVVFGTDGRLLFFNDQAAQTFGWSRADIVGAHVASTLVPPDELPHAYEVVKLVEDGQRWSGDMMIRRGDGVAVRTAINISPLLTDTGTVVGSIATAEDVSTQRALEQRVNRTVNYLLQALAGGEVGTFHWEFSNNTVSWDEVASAIYEADGADSAHFEEWMDLVDERDRDGVREARIHAAASDQYYRAQYRHTLPDGSVRWIDERGAAWVDNDGTIVGIVGIMADASLRVEREIEVNARAQEAMRQAHEEAIERGRLEFFTEIDRLTRRATDHRDLMHQLADICVPYLSDWCSIHFCGDGAQRQSFPEVVVAHRDPSHVDLLHQLLVKHPPSSDLPVGAGAVIRTGIPQHMESFDWMRSEAQKDAAKQWADDAFAFFGRFEPVSLVAVPLITPSGIVGAIQFVTEQPGRVLTTTDFEMLQTAADRIAEALEVTWLRDEQRTLATTLQTALLPPKLRRVNGIDLAVRYWVAGAMSEVGGDFYDLFSLPDTPGGNKRWAVVIGDVCGTGPAAAAVTAIARHTVRAAARHGASHTEVLEWLNEAILLSDRDRFCTIVYSTLSENGDGTWTFESVSGGHPLPVLVDGLGNAANLGEPGTLMGVLPTINTSPQRRVLQPGESVVMYTDGFTDVPGGHGIVDDDFLTLVEKVHRDGADADDIADRFGDAIEAILPMADRDDDMALLVLRVGEPRGGDVEPLVLLGQETFEPDERAVSATRRFVDGLIGQIANSDAVVLGVSELATNAVIHAQSAFTVAVRASHSVIRVEVTDSTPESPVVAPTAPVGVGGRGIQILEHLSTRWGVTERYDTKTVWFEVVGPQVRRVRRANGPRLAPPQPMTPVHPSEIDFGED